MRKFFILFLMCAFYFTQAQNVSLTEATKVASLYFSHDHSNQIACALVAKDKFDTLFYVMNYEDSWVLISGDKNCVPILAFSNEGRFAEDDVIPPVKMWMDNYENQIKEMKSRKSINPEAQAQWKKLLSSKSDELEIVKEVSPLLTSKWGQDDKYNFYCPKDLNGKNGRVVTGCVATALAQILYYFRFPESGTGSYTYEHDTYGTLSANFEEATYDYEGMADVPGTINPAASLLISHLGISVDMVYGAGASGMFNHKGAYTLHTYFKYSPETQYLFRDSTTVNWDSVIVHHLDQKIPLYYAGWGRPYTEGHGFVCDGYKLYEDSSYYYHFNFGWNGSYDGYFYTDNLVVGGANFKLVQELIINAYPDTTQYTYPNAPLTGSRTLTDESGSFHDGSAPAQGYNTNMDYTWIIKPDVDNLTSISFDFNYQIAENDTLFITTNDNAIQDYILTKDSASLSFTSKGTEIRVRFKSADQENNLPGFKGNYKSNYTQFCTRTTLYPEQTGQFGDGSGNLNYNNCSYCEKSIIVSIATPFITLTFDSFETEEGEDILYIYDSRSKTLLETLSGNHTGRSFTFNTNRLDLIFETSASVTYPGWELTYTASTTGISNHNEKKSYTLYPNPANDYIYLQTNENSISDHQPDIYLYDIYGRLLLQQKTTGESTLVNVANLSSGIYILKVMGNRGLIESFKIVKD